MFNKIIQALTIPIMILNFGGGIVGGIWLAFLGAWKLIIIGIVLVFVSHWLLALLMMPSLLISGVALKFGEKNKFVLYLFGLLSQLYTNILIVATCVFAFLLCSSFYKGTVGVSYIPYLLWSWGMALGPWQFFASKEPENAFSAMTLFCASIFYLLFLISIFISPILSLIIVGIFVLVQFLILPAFNMYVASKMENY
jgi:hypothetical protein